MPRSGHSGNPTPLSSYSLSPSLPHLTLLLLLSLSSFPFSYTLIFSYFLSCSFPQYLFSYPLNLFPLPLSPAYFLSPPPLFSLFFLSLFTLYYSSLSLFDLFLSLVFLYSFSLSLSSLYLSVFSNLSLSHSLLCLSLSTPLLFITSSNFLSIPCSPRPSRRCRVTKFTVIRLIRSQEERDYSEGTTAPGLARFAADGGV